MQHSPSLLLRTAACGFINVYMKCRSHNSLVNRYSMNFVQAVSQLLFYFIAAVRSFVSGIIMSALLNSADVTRTGSSSSYIGHIAFYMNQTWLFAKTKQINNEFKI